MTRKDVKKVCYLKSSIWEIKMFLNIALKENNNLTKKSIAWICKQYHWQGVRHVYQVARVL